MTMCCRLDTGQLCLLLGLLLSVACSGGSTEPVVDAASAGPDLVDVRVDSSAADTTGDLPSDQGAEGSMDVGGDRGEDRASDSAADLLWDISGDSAPDLVVDVASDSAPDLVVDTLTDTGSDLIAWDSVQDQENPEEVTADAMEVVCIPDCLDKDCGPDGCGGDCGLCGDELPCTDDVCVEGGCDSPLAAGWCLVVEECVEAGSPEPGNPCGICDSASDPLGWSPVADGTSCGPGQACLYGVCLDLCFISAFEGSSEGCTFWAVDLDNAFVPGGRDGYYDAAGAPYALVVANPSFTEAAEILIEDSDGPVLLDGTGGPLPSLPILPGESQVYFLPRRDANGTVRASLAYRLTSSIPVSVVQHNPLEVVDVFSNDASLLLPPALAGTSYTVMTRQQSFSILRSFLTVVAVEAGITSVTVTVTGTTLAGTDEVTGEGIGALAPGESLSASLQPFDVLNIETNEVGADLTGTLISASQPVLVFAGSEAANAPFSEQCLPEPGGPLGLCAGDGATPCGGVEDCVAAGLATCCADHLEEQLLPIPLLGTHYFVARTWPRNEAEDVIRILAAGDGVVVETIPEQVVIPVLNQGDWVEFESGEDFEVLASGPVMLGQFLAGQDAPDPNVFGIPQAGDAGIGDPAFLLGIPSSRFRTTVLVTVVETYEYDYVTIVAPVGASVWLDCAAQTPEDAALLCDPLPQDMFVLFGSGTHAVARLPVADGTHRLLSDAPLGVHQYGWDQYVSYGHPGGM